MKWIDRCLGSIKSSSVKSDVFIIDNGSTDGTQDYIKKTYPEVIFKQSETNLGFGKANNIGMQFALQKNYDYIYLLNQDAWIFENTIEKLIEIFRNNPEYVILSPIQMQANMKHLDKSFNKITCSYGYNNEIFEDMLFQRRKPLYEVPDVMAAHWFMKSDTLRKVGGFSPAFPHYAEDNNYCHRCKYFGVKIGIVPSLTVVHDREYRRDSINKRTYLFYVQSIARLSNPLVQSGKMFWIRFIKEIIKFAYLSKSLTPFKYIFMLAVNRRQIAKFKKISISEVTPFLS